jgi:PPOX class probable F420-dependent enzyme
LRKLITAVEGHYPHLQDDGILVNPVWCDDDRTYVLINSAQGRVKDRMVRRPPTVTLCIADPDNPYRYLEIRGRVAAMTTDGAEAHIDRLAQRYLGQETYPFRQPGEVRVLYRIAPEKVVPFAA